MDVYVVSVSTQPKTGDFWWISTCFRSPCARQEELFGVCGGSCSPVLWSWKILGAVYWTIVHQKVAGTHPHSVVTHFLPLFSGFCGGVWHRHDFLGGEFSFFFFGSIFVKNVQKKRIWMFHCRAICPIDLRLCCRILVFIQKQEMTRCCDLFLHHYCVFRLCYFSSRGFALHLLLLPDTKLLPQEVVNGYWCFMRVLVLPVWELLSYDRGSEQLG